MEISEIISYYVNPGTHTLDIKFRLSEDLESEVRIDEIDLSEAEDFGYNLILEDFEFYDEEEDSINLDLGEDIDEQELLSFLNEYYLIYPDRLPLKDLY